VLFRGSVDAQRQGHWKMYLANKFGLAAPILMGETFSPIEIQRKWMGLYGDDAY
jgi:hypothetical protein